MSGTVSRPIEYAWLSVEALQNLFYGVSQTAREIELTAKEVWGRLDDGEVCKKDGLSVSRWKHPTIEGLEGIHIIDDVPKVHYLYTWRVMENYRVFHVRKGIDCKPSDMLQTLDRRDEGYALTMTTGATINHGDTPASFTPSKGSSQISALPNSQEDVWWPLRCVL